MLSSTARTWVATSKAAFSICCLRMATPPPPRATAGRLDWPELALAWRLALEQPGETFEPGEIHPRRKRCARRDQEDPEQPEADAHLIPGMTPRCERQRQGRPGRPRTQLGFEPEAPGLPCTVSVPNLNTDRTAGMGLGTAALNVRRLMYQSLIWPVHLRDQPRSLRPALDAEHVQGTADALIDSMGGNAELDRNLFGRPMLVDQQQAVELRLTELGDL